MTEPTKEETQPVKFTLTHHRKEGVTHEAFMYWISTVHVPKALPVFQKHGVIGYALFDTPATFNDPFREKMAVMKPTWEVADYDCIIEYTLPSVETIEAIMGDPEWAESVADQVDWVDMSKALLTLGLHTKYLHDGKMVSQA